MRSQEIEGGVLEDLILSKRYRRNWKVLQGIDNEAIPKKEKKTGTLRWKFRKLNVGNQVCGLRIRNRVIQA